MPNPTSPKLNTGFYGDTLEGRWRIRLLSLNRAPVGQAEELMSTLGVTSGPRTDRVIRWFLEGDPAIRWQALRDLVEAAERTVEQSRRKVARDVWEAHLVDRQDPEGT